MSSAGAAPAAVSPAGVWIESRRYDLALIVLAPLLGLVLTGVARAVSEEALLTRFFVEGNFLLLGMPHYLATYSFFLDDRNAAYYRSRKVAFYLGPVVVIGLLTLSLGLRLYSFVNAAVQVWNAYHVSRQSIGILSIYRRKAGGDSARERLPANLALLGINVGMFFVGGRDDRQLAAFLPSRLSAASGFLLLGVGAVALGLLVVRMARRPAAVPATERLFIVTSILLFAPYLLLESVTLATSAMLAGHYVQYLGVIWLLNHRKYPVVSGSRRQRALAVVSLTPARILGAIVATALSMILVDQVIHHFHAWALHTWWLNAVVLLHFYFDGLWWAFRRPFIRESIGAYLFAPRPARLVAGT